MFTVVNIIDSYRGEAVKWYEAACKLWQRRLVIRFCRSVLSGENKQICRIIDEHDFSALNVGVMKLTRDTFEDSFKRVCKDLFSMRPAHTSYIIVVFAYALKLDEYHRCKAWYETDILICSLTDVLIANGFEAYTSNLCTLL